MICETIIAPDGTRMIACSGRRRRPRCAFGCGAFATKQCDFPRGKGTCDRHLCDAHAVNVGPDRDYCHDHEGRPAPQLTLEGL
jgi:hypothetical protein